MTTNNSIFCNFILIKPNTYQCSKCGVVLVAEDGSIETPILPCSAPLLEYSAANIQKFVAENVASTGLCTEEEIQARHSICESCEFFKDNSCTKCGCLLSRDRIYMNKLAFKTASCPIDKW